MRQDFNTAFSRASMRISLRRRCGGPSRLALADEVID
jgi:hypothetical protein